VLGDFVLIREIGSGGMGIVFEAEQIPLHRKVALKLLPAYRSLDPRQVERFRREASATAGLNHPGIVPVHSVGEAEGTHYIAMDLVAGEGLNALLKRLAGRNAGDILGRRVASLFIDSGIFSVRASAIVDESRLDSGGSSSERGSSSTSDSSFPDEALSPAYAVWAATLAMEAARALHHAHVNGIIHRDVKPGNILVRKGGRPVLVDFGLAHQEGAASMTATGEFLGSFHYVSPEQASSGSSPLDHRTDIYSLGVTLYEMLSLRVPFHKGTHHTVIDQILTVEPPSLTKTNPAVPRDLATIVAKAMEKDRNHRYETAEEMADDLSAFLHNRPIRARPAGAVTRIMKFTQRNRTLMGSIASVLVIAVVISIGALFWWLGQEKRFSRRQMDLRAKESALLEERTDDLLRKLRPIIEGGTPELAYLDLMKAIRGMRGNEEVQRKIIGYADTLQQKGLVFSAGRPLKELLAAEPPADVAARAHNVLGLCSFYYLHIDEAGKHLERAAALAAARTATAHETRINMELLHLCAPARFGLKELKTAAGGSMRITPGYAVCLDINDDGIDEIVVSCHGEGRQLLSVIGWNEEGNLKSRQILFDWSCGVELSQICWFRRQCEGPGSPEYYAIASRQGRKEGLISQWRRSGESQALTLCWSHAFDSCPTDLASGDIDGDGSEELLVVTSGHHRFGLFHGCLEEGRFIETGELSAGVLNGMALLPASGSAPPSLIAARGFTPRRADLDAKIDPRFDRSGFYRIAHEESGWEIDSLWSPPREAGFWFAPRDPVVGRIGRSANQRDSADHFVIAFLNWRKELEGTDCVENAGGVLLQPDRSSFDGWRGTVFTGQFLMATGQLDDDASSEIILYNASGLHILGVHRPSHDPAPHVIGPDEPSGNFSNFMAMDQAGIKLIDLAAAVVDGAPVAEPATIAVQALADQAQFVLAHRVLDSWQWGDAARSDDFGVVRADLDLARGDYARAVDGYDALHRAGASAVGGLKMGDLSLDDRRRLAGRLLTGGTRLLDEGFEAEGGGSLLPRPGRGHADSAERRDRPIRRTLRARQICRPPECTRRTRSGIAHGHLTQHESHIPMGRKETLPAQFQGFRVPSSLRGHLHGKIRACR